MARVAGPVRAIGWLPSRDAWVGFQASGGSYRVVFGTTDGRITPDATRRASARRDGLIAAAIAYFEESLAGPPPELEATHADLAELIAELTRTEQDPDTAHRLREALDAVDDGLAGDAVALRLAAARSPGRVSDARAVLGERYRALPGPGFG